MRQNDWPSIGAALDDVGCAVTPSVLSAQECRALVELYDTGRFRKTIDMARHRFGSGEYRYFERPLPQLVTRLRAAFWPHLLPIARDWAERLGRPAPWPDELLTDLASVTIDDFEMTQPELRPIDDSLDLVAIAVRP